MVDWRVSILSGLDETRPVLITGPTASGKSALALDIARSLGGRIINADALQVYADWRILTARPTVADEAQVPHALYGHISGDRSYSVGDWLRDVATLLDGPRPIIVGGTGLYFRALTEGLAEIPETPPAIRAEADERLAREGPASLLAEIDPATAGQIDRLNPARVQRAWEVQKATGRGLAQWQVETGPPLLPLDKVQTVLLNADRDWLNDRIAARFRMMMAQGLMDEARASQSDWDPKRPSSKAIGAAEVMAFLAGEIDEDTLAQAVGIQTRQYAKRQRTWFRKRMKPWNWQSCH